MVWALASTSKQSSFNAPAAIAQNSKLINCDLPWNPAKLEQRIARAWRKNQRRPVTVINLIAENTIEHGMLTSLANKMELAQGMLDGVGDLSRVKLKSGRQALLKRLEQVLASVPSGGVQPATATPPSDPAMARLMARLGPPSTSRRCAPCRKTRRQSPLPRSLNFCSKPQRPRTHERLIADR
jgi:hypothetical protein